MISALENQRRKFLGERLRKLRLSQGLKQAEMAKKLAVSPTSYMLYEQGKREPSIKNLINISHILNTSIDLLLNYEPNQIHQYIEAKNFWLSIGEYKIEKDQDSESVLFILPQSDELTFSKTGEVLLNDKQNKAVVFTTKDAFINFTNRAKKKVDAATLEKKKEICLSISSKLYEDTKK